MVFAAMIIASVHSSIVLYQFYCVVPVGRFISGRQIYFPTLGGLKNGTE